MTLTFPDELLVATNMTEQEMAAELAVTLYQRGKISIGRASELAGIGRIEFQHLLASRGIPLNYDRAEFEKDIANLRELGRL
ncbi:MAG TPA: UPF0175 family protein [Longimicrobium sp.]|nr:UPF0175 family protein [Longimicrobium sp.]